jgi:hypothetical protein
MLVVSSNAKRKNNLKTINTCIMKKTILLVLISMAVIISSCKKDKNKKDNNSNDNNSINKHVTIKGKLAGSKKHCDSLSLSDAKKILVFGGLNLHGGYQGGGLALSMVDIVNGAFTATSNIGTATALVFLDINNKYIGTLSMQGLNMLPLGDLIHGDSTTIDLSTLTLVGNSVVPSHDPLGNEIIITQAEINSLKETEGFFESLAKNIDADNDGVLDYLSNRQIFVKSLFYIKAGTFGTNTTQPFIADSAVSTIAYAMNVSGGAGFVTPDTVRIIGPEGNPNINCGINVQNTSDNGHGWNIGTARQGNLPLDSGIYDLYLDGTPYTFSFSDIDAKYNLVFVTPTLNINSSGQLVSFSLKYQHSDYTNVNPDNIITNIMLQFNDSTCHQIYNSPTIFSSDYAINGNYGTGFYSYTLPSPVDISTLRFIDVGYNDLLGNGYSNRWFK